MTKQTLVRTYTVPFDLQPQKQNKPAGREKEENSYPKEVEEGPGFQVLGREEARDDSEPERRRDRRVRIR